MSIHISAKPGEIADKILLMVIHSVLNLSLKTSLKMQFASTKFAICSATQGPTRVIVSLSWEQVWGCHPSLSMPMN